VAWDQQFYEPIPLSKGKPLVTLRDAALYITKLPKAEQQALECQAAVQNALVISTKGKKFNNAAGLPLLDEQNKSRVHSHLSA
jgi:hypothetical protein